MKIKIHRYIALSTILFLVSCATDYKRWPSGGEADRISPKITHFTPSSGSLNQDKDITAEIEFSEFIDYGSTRNAITISPFSVQEKAKITWYEKSVEIEFSDLEDDQTVLIALNSSLTDLRKNNIKNNFILNFSTGSKIDKKELYGIIDGAIIENSLVGLNYSKLKMNLYRKKDFSFYKFNSIRPEYIVGVSSDMSYRFSNISSDIYVPVIYYDVNNNSKIELENEYIALSGSVDLKNQDKYELDLTLAKIDTVPPFIKEVTQVENNVLQIELSEKVQLEKNMLASITQGGSTIEFMELFDEDVEDKFYVRSKFDISKELNITLENLRDIYGNLINENMREKTVFIGDSVKKQKLIITPNFKEKIFKDQKIAFKYNWIEPDSVGIELISSIDSTITSLDSMITIKPFVNEINLNKLTSEQGKYTLVVKYGNKKIFTKNIDLENDLGYGSVSGKIENTSNKANVIFKSCDNSANSVEKNGVLSNYIVKMRPGKYICAAYLDANGDDLFTLDHSQLTIEKSVIKKDTILVRKNWESGDINFDF